MVSEANDLLPMSLHLNMDSKWYEYILFLFPRFNRVDVVGFLHRCEFMYIKIEMRYSNLEFYLFIHYIDTDKWGLKEPGSY